MATAVSKTKKANTPPSKFPAGEYHYATGKRKTAIARVRLYKGKGEILINGHQANDYIKSDYNRPKILTPLKLAGKIKDFDLHIEVEGGGDTAQAEAIRHGISRALIIAEASLRGTLKKAGLLTRDSRIKERKKYGLRRARRAPQWQKR